MNCLGGWDSLLYWQLTEAQMNPVLEAQMYFVLALAKKCLEIRQKDIFHCVVAENINYLLSERRDYHIQGKEAICIIELEVWKFNAK